MAAALPPMVVPPRLARRRAAVWACGFLLAVAALAVLPAWYRRMHPDIGEWWALGPAFIGSWLLFFALDLCEASEEDRQRHGVDDLLLTAWTRTGYRTINTGKVVSASCLTTGSPYSVSSLVKVKDAHGVRMGLLSDDPELRRVLEPYFADDFSVRSRPDVSEWTLRVVGGLGSPKASGVAQFFIWSFVTIGIGLAPPAIAGLVQVV